MPLLEASWREYKDSVLFVGVNTQESSKNDAQALMNEFGLSYPNGRDESNRLNPPTAKAAGFLHHRALLPMRESDMHSDRRLEGPTNRRPL